MTFTFLSCLRFGKDERAVLIPPSPITQIDGLSFSSSAAPSAAGKEYPIGEFAKKKITFSLFLRPKASATAF